jgi:hypothetical protein
VTGYVKLFGSIIGSTIWNEDPATKVVWVTMMALADRDGIVESSVPGLANYARVSIAETETALRKFQSPDPYSSTPDHEGRRIERVDGGWRLLNHAKYRERMSPEDIRERARLRQQKYRDTHRVTPKRNASVTRRDGHNESRISRHTEAEAYTEPKAEGQTPSPHPSDEPDGVPPSGALNSQPPKAKLEILAESIYPVYPRKVARGAALKAITKAVSAVARRGATDLHPDFGGDTSLAAEWLKERTSAYGRSPQGQRTDKNYIPHPATWFNDARYEDDAEEWDQVGTPHAKSSTRATPHEVSGSPHEGFEDVLSRALPLWAERSK